MAEVVERVANLEGRWDAQAKQLDNIHESLVRLEDKMERYHALLDAVADDRELRTDIELILGRASTMLRLARQVWRPRSAS